MDFSHLKFIIMSRQVRKNPYPKKLSQNSIENKTFVYRKGPKTKLFGLNKNSTIFLNSFYSEKGQPTFKIQ